MSLLNYFIKPETIVQGLMKFFNSGKEMNFSVRPLADDEIAIKINKNEDK